jgi:integrase
MPRYLLQQRRGWYATLEIPRELRTYFGKARFKQTLGTDSLSLAKLRVLPIVAGWKAEIEGARTGRRLPVGSRELLEWQKDYLNSAGEDRETLDHVLSCMVEDMAFKNPGGADSLYKVVTGASLPLSLHVEEWIGTLEDQQKTLDMKQSNVLDFCKSFEFSHQVSRQSVKEWSHKLLHTHDQAKKTVQRKLSFLSGYWRFLQSAGYLKGDDEPFRGIVDSPKKDRTKAASKRGWIALEDQEVVAALDQALDDGDHNLAALIWLGMWTGCRIEELCSLRVEDVSEDRMAIRDAKTEAGNRIVPLHSHLKRALLDLKATSYDGYVLSGLTENKYGDRSNAIGKRFGRTARRMKLGERKVFHSLRKTVVTQLENAGTPVGFISDIVGHEKASFTLSRYSAGTFFEEKVKAIEHLSYPLKASYRFANKWPT